MTASVFTLLLAALAVWRVSHLLAREDGPWDVIVRLRRRLGRGLWGSLFDCLYCLSLWIAVPFALLFRPTLAEFVLLWLGLSGAACLLDRFAAPPVVIEPLPEEKKDGEGGGT